MSLKGLFVCYGNGDEAYEESVSGVTARTSERDGIVSGRKAFRQ